MEKIFSNPETVDIIMRYSIPIVVIIAYYWYKVQKNRWNNEIKQSMINRGMSAQDIEQVINAGRKKGGKTFKRPNIRLD